MSAFFTVYGFSTWFKFRNDATEDRSFRSYRTKRLQPQERAAILLFFLSSGLLLGWGEDGFRAEDAADITHSRERQAFSGRRKRFFGKEEGQWWWCCIRGGGYRAAGH